jgi:hypothetical protein
MVVPNRLSYLQSLAAEISVQAKRVRDLIGKAHWLTDGHHKEFLFLSLLERHLPSGMIASRGFVVGHSDENICSTEQDVLVVDTTVEAPLFNQGGVIIAFPHQVRAVISVKTEVSEKMVKDSTVGMATILESGVAPGNLWCGVYFFEPCGCKPDTLAKYLKKAGEFARTQPNVPADWQIDAVACSNDLLCLKRVHAQDDGASATVLRGYTDEGLSTAVFLGQLRRLRLSSAPGRGPAAGVSAHSGPHTDGGSLKLAPPSRRQGSSSRALLNCGRFRSGTWQRD